MMSTEFVSFDAPELPEFVNADFQDSFQSEAHTGGAVCDLVMKGGITSGLVYPDAVLYLASNTLRGAKSGPAYRFAGIGGTSVGAIAAVLTAAAEYGRYSRLGGFLGLQSAKLELKNGVDFLLHPGRGRVAAFNLLLFLLSFKSLLAGKVSWQKSVYETLAIGRGGWLLALTLVIGPFWAISLANFMRPDGYELMELLRQTMLVSVFLAVATGLGAIALARADAKWGYAGIGVILSAALIQLWSPFEVFNDLIAAIVGATITAGLLTTFILATLAKNRFGLCSGLATQRYSKQCTQEGLVDWLHRHIQSCCSLANAQPLTFGELSSAPNRTNLPPIDLRMMASNLSTRTGLVLAANETVDWWIDLKEWSSLFPLDVVTFLAGRLTETAKQGERTWHRLCSLNDLPVVCATRMSLSFPIMFEAIPIWRKANSTDSFPTQRMLISDGGITSNLPIHFFDTLAPAPRPTFAFSLAERDNSGPIVSMIASNQDAPEPKFVEQESFFGFVNSIRETASQWGDTALSELPGNADRIVIIHLDDHEGGLNLMMTAETIAGLFKKGLAAGEAICIGYTNSLNGPTAGPFDLVAHRAKRIDTLHSEVIRGASEFQNQISQANLANLPPFNQQTSLAAIQLNDLVVALGALASMPQTGGSAKVRLRLSPRNR
jgi:predicted acylesterase/phospholipase RssA